MKITVNFDGGSRGNPGQSACAYVIHYNDKYIEKGFYLGIMTNNQAEYHGLIKSLEQLKNIENSKNAEIIIYSDSELIVRQINGIYKVKNEKLKSLYIRALELMQEFNNVKLEHVKREFNKDADRLLNEVLNREMKL